MSVYTLHYYFACKIFLDLDGSKYSNQNNTKILNHDRFGNVCISVCIFVSTIIFKANAQNVGFIILSSFGKKCVEEPRKTDLSREVVLSKEITTALIS